MSLTILSWQQDSLSYMLYVYFHPRCFHSRLYTHYPTRSEQDHHQGHVSSRELRVLFLWKQPPSRLRTQSWEDASWMSSTSIRRIITHIVRVREWLVYILCTLEIFSSRCSRNCSTLNFQVWSHRVHLRAYSQPIHVEFWVQWDPTFTDHS